MNENMLVYICMYVSYKGTILFRDDNDEIH